MLKKLWKYELMATGRIFLPLFAALLVVSIINRLFSSLGMTAPSVIGIVLSVIIIIGICVLTLILTLQRFRNNLLSSEGYLMMTLPVSTDSIILSKLFTASIWNIASFVIVVISILIMALSGISIPEIIENIRVFFSQITMPPATHVVIYTIEALVAIILSLFSGILLLYTCMSLSMLVNKRRGLFTFGAFIVITTAMQTVFVVVGAIGAAVGIYDLFNTSALSEFMQIQLVIFVVIVAEAATCFVFYYITRYMLKNRLNLQ